MLQRTTTKKENMANRIGSPIDMFNDITEIKAKESQNGKFIIIKSLSRLFEFIDKENVKFGENTMDHIKIGHIYSFTSFPCSDKGSTGPFHTLKVKLKSIEYENLIFEYIFECNDLDFRIIQFIDLSLKENQKLGFEFKNHYRKKFNDPTSGSINLPYGMGTTYVGRNGNRINIP